MPYTCLPVEAPEVVEVPLATPPKQHDTLSLRIVGQLYPPARRWAAAGVIGLATFAAYVDLHPSVHRQIGVGGSDDIFARSKSGRRSNDGDRKGTTDPLKARAQHCGHGVQNTHEARQARVSAEVRTSGKAGGEDEATAAFLRQPPAGARPPA